MKSFSTYTQEQEDVLCKCGVPCGFFTIKTLTDLYFIANYNCPNLDNISLHFRNYGDTGYTTIDIEEIFDFVCSSQYFYLERGDKNDLYLIAKEIINGYGIKGFEGKDIFKY